MKIYEVCVWCLSNQFILAQSFGAWVTQKSACIDLAWRGAACVLTSYEPCAPSRAAAAEPMPAWRRAARPRPRGTLQSEERHSQIDHGSVNRAVITNRVHEEMDCRVLMYAWI